jgi:hypothetical protein
MGVCVPVFFVSPVPAWELVASGFVEVSNALMPVAVGWG